MCRIVGFWDFNAAKSYEPMRVIAAMRDVMAYAGPDDQGEYYDASSGLALGHRRLSVIDLSAFGHQPMSNPRGSLWIVYNGEVYNFQAIRGELEEQGQTFVSRSDTEVVLKAYETWGPACVERFRGMWAFAIWDNEKQTLTLCRDRVGVKPLYWYFKDGLFMFASELKAFHVHPGFRKELDEQALALYLRHGYITAPYTIFRHTHKLEPGHWLVVNNKAEIRSRRYWDIGEHSLTGTPACRKHPPNTATIIRELEDVLTEAFSLRLVADVPVGIFLSGGVDSSLVTALLQKKSTRPLKTFTIGFHEPNYDEAPWAKRVAGFLGTDHTEFYCTPKDAFTIIPQLATLYDEPFGDSSAIPTFLVSRLARQHVTVALSADGGDEQFFGYDKYRNVWRHLNRMHRQPFRSAVSALVNLINPDLAFSLYRASGVRLEQLNNFAGSYQKLREILTMSDHLEQFNFFSQIFWGNHLRDLGIVSTQDMLFKRGDIRNRDMRDEMMLFDIRTYLPDDILTKVDRATMGVALEAREPFLDHKILEFSAGLPMELKYNRGVSKVILKKILYSHVPEALVNRPKKGFGVPIYHWFKKELRPLYLEYLNAGRIRREGIFNPDAVQGILDDYLVHGKINSDKPWLLFMFQRWREQWL